MKILIVEDDENIFEMLKKELLLWNYEVNGISNFNQIVEEFVEYQPHLVLMDIMLPYNNGYFWCEEIRKHSNVPIIFISSKSENIDIVMGIQFGADDYITKPIDLNVTLAKIKAILRRSYDFTKDFEFLSFANAFLSMDKNKVKYDDNAISLTNTETMILETLFKAKGGVASRESIMEKCWHGDDYIDDNTLAVNITRLRKKFADIKLNGVKMDKFKNYISKILPVTVATFFILSVFWVVFFLMNLGFENYVLAFEIVIFFFIVYLIFMAFLNKKEKKLKNQIQELEEANLNLRNDFLAKEKELQEYFLIWIHQIKTPITAGKLICDSDIENENIKNIKKELIHIEDYTNMALSYLKMINHNTDMDISLVNLDDIINPLIKKYAILFISNNIKLEYEKLNVKVITDSKWCMVVIEQLLSNAIKYTKNGIVSISFNEKENYLEIKDNGIGIKDSDLPKIFDKGYSGFNGRQNQKSTGIGLFLVKQILDKLGQKVKLESKLGEGTSVKVYFNID